MISLASWPMNASVQDPLTINIKEYLLVMSLSPPDEEA